MRVTIYYMEWYVGVGGILKVFER